MLICLIYDNSHYIMIMANAYLYKGEISYILSNFIHALTTLPCTLTTIKCTFTLLIYLHSNISLETHDGMIQNNLKFVTKGIKQSRGKWFRENICDLGRNWYLMYVRFAYHTLTNEPNIKLNMFCMLVQR